MTDWTRWSSDTFGFAESWNNRARIAARYIPPNSHVLDLGCGRMALRQYLPDGCTYQGCDLIEREPGTIVCDFNKGEFPEAVAQSDVVTALGVLEYINEPGSFLDKLKAPTVILSYHPVDMARVNRDKLGWVNAMTENEVLNRLNSSRPTAITLSKSERLYVIQRQEP